MTWERIISASIAAAIGLISWAFSAGGVWTSQAAVPGRVEKVEERLQQVEQGQTRVEGKVDTVINLLRGRK